MKRIRYSRFCLLILQLIFVQACNLPGRTVTPQATIIPVEMNATSGPVVSSLTPQVLIEPRPADSDTPAAGICSPAEGEIIEILLGSGPDGLPLGGRCIQITADQRLRLVNKQEQDYTFQFAHYNIQLAAGEEKLLDLPVGDYLAVGVHIMPNAPEIWLIEQ